MASTTESTADKIARLRAALERARTDLIEAEAELADELVDIEAFEFEFEAHVGHLLEQLSRVEAEVNDYLARIKRMRNERTFGTPYESADEQYRRVWRRRPSTNTNPPPKQPPPATQAQIKKLYRQLARRFHPDLAVDESDRVYRTDKMAAINDAYKARSMVELMALAEELEERETVVSQPASPPDADMAQALQEELDRCRRRLRQIDNELRNLHNRPIVDLALEVKLARRQGRDLLAEMAADLEQRIARKTAERDMLKAQFDNLDRGG